MSQFHNDDEVHRTRECTRFMLNLCFMVTARLYHLIDDDFAFGKLYYSLKKVFKENVVLTWLNTSFIL